MKRILTLGLCLCLWVCMLVLPAGAEPEQTLTHGNHCACSGSYISGGDKDCLGYDHNTNQQWYAWTSTTKLPQHNSEGLDADGNPVAGARYYYLTEDVVLSEKYTSSGRTYICLNGHSITAPKGINIVGDFFIVDCTADFDSSGYLTNDNGITGPITANAHLRLYGVNLKGGSQSALTVPNGKTITAKFCKFSNNEAAAGGAMSVEGGTVNLTKCYFTGNESTGNGGAIDIKSGSPTVNIDDCKFSGNTAGGKGGALSVTNGATPKLTVTDSTFSGNSASAGGAVYSSKSLNATTNVAFTDCAFSNNSATGNGGAVYLNAGNLTISGGTYKNNQAANGGVVTIASIVTGNVTLKGGAVFEGNTASTGAVICQFGGPVSIDGVTMKNNTASSGGGAIYQLKGTCAVKDTTFTGNAAGFRGGAICLPEGSQGTITLSGGQLKGNKVTDSGSYGGGALFVYDGTATLTGVTITENTNRGRHGSAINLGEANTKAASVTLTDCTIKDNTNKSKDNRAAVTVYSDKCAFKLAGLTVMENNLNDGFKLDIFLRKAGAKVTLDALTQGSKMNIYTLEHNMDSYKISFPVADPDAFLTKGTLTSLDDVTILYENSVEQVYYSGSDGFYFKGKVSDHSHCFCGDGKGTGCTHSDKVAWVAWDRADSLPVNPGSYYLTTDVKLSTAAVMTGTSKVNLCLNGHSITASSSKEKWVYSLNYDAVLTLSDCKASGKLTGGTDGCIRLRKTDGAKGATFNLYDGIITGNTRQYAGAGVLLLGNGTFNMYGGQISNNKGQGCGGGISAENNCKVNIYAGQITGNSAGTYGGGIFVANKCVFNMDSGATVSGHQASNGGGLSFFQATGTINGGNIKNNIAKDNGGGIQLQNSTLYLYGGTVSGCQSQLMGGGIYATGASSRIRMAGGRVTGNKSEKGGGILLIGDCSMNMSGGSVTNNNSTMTGGLFVANGCTMTMSGGTISGNKAPAGAGLVLYKAEVTMTDGLIKGNIASEMNSGGGGVRVNQNSTFLMSGGNIEENNGAGLGGGVLVQNESKMVLQGGIIRGNQAEKGGGILLLHDCTMEYSDGQILENSATSNAGGLFVANDSFLTMTGGLISGNTAPNAGGLDHYKGETTMTGGIIKGNTATNTNGGGGGVRVPATSTFNMQGGVIQENITAGMGGGLFLNGKSNVTLSGGSVLNNTANYGGGIHCSGNTALAIGQILIQNNSATEAGGGIYISSGSTMFNGAVVTGNHAGVSGGGIAFRAYAIMNIMSGEITNNTTDGDGGGIHVQRAVLNIRGGKITGNTAGGLGGGIYNDGQGMPQVKEDSFPVSGAYIANNSAKTGGIYLVWINARFSDCVVEGNSAVNGGGLSHGTTQLTYLNNVEFKGNTASENGGTLYLTRGSKTYMDACRLTGNKAGKDGGGLWLNDEMAMTNMTVIGNSAGGLGGGIYLAPASYDGHSYISGTVKIGGQMTVSDNQGRGDLFVSEGTLVNMTAEGLTGESKVGVTLESGLLTNTVLGLYDYQGGDKNYTMTAGSRSVDEPETAPFGGDRKVAFEITPTVAIIAAAAAVVLLGGGAAVLILLRKKKKPVQAVEGGAQ